MDSNQFHHRARALRAQAAQLGADLAAAGASMDPGVLFEVTGELQGAANAVEGAQLVAIAHAGSHEQRLTERGVVDTHRELGFIDAMTASEVSLATGLGQWAAGRKVGQAAALAGRFPRLLAKVTTGDLAAVNAAKVSTACDGLDRGACAAVEAVMVDRLPGMDPAHITTLTRRVATRIAADQVAAATAKNKRDRCVQVTPGPDGTTDWWARLPVARSAQAWAAITTLADDYTKKDAELTLDQARADAFMDLLLTNVTTTAHVTLGIPVLTGPDAEAARHAALAANTAVDTTDDTTPDAPDSPSTAPGTATLTGAGTPRVRSGAGRADEDTEPTTGAASTGPGSGCSSGSGEDTPWLRPAFGTGGAALGQQFSLSAALLSGCEIPGIGFIDAETIENLLAVVPTEIGRALLDARTGTLIESVSTAYRPPKAITDFVTTRDGTCRMWGCARPARRCDIDHARPWPAGTTTPTNLGGLCRRHHRLKQLRRWTYRLAPDGTATWTSPTGRTRTTHPDHMALPPPTPPPAPTPPEPDRELVAVEAPPF